MSDIADKLQFHYDHGGGYKLLLEAKERIERLEAALSEAYAVADAAKIGLEEARKSEIERCEEIGFNEDELPPDAFDYIDAPLSFITSLLSRRVIAKEPPNGQG